MQEPLLIGIPEAAQVIGVGRNTMLKMVKIKGFPAIVTKHKIYVDRNNLQQWIEKNYGTYK